MPSPSNMRRACVTMLLCWFVLTIGCSVLRNKQRTTKNVAPYTLTEEEHLFAKALAHYGKGLLCQDERGIGSTNALAHYKSALALDPDNHDLYARIAVIEIQRGQEDKAIDILNQSALNFPDSFQRRIDLAATCQSLGKTNKAITAFMDAIRIDPEKTPVYLTIAGLLFRQNKDTDALDILSDAIRKSSDPDAAIKYCHTQAKRFIHYGAMDRAIPCFKKLTDWDNDNAPQFYRTLAAIYDVSDNNKLAVRYLKRAIRHKKASPETYIDLAEIYRKSKTELTLPTLLKARDRFPESSLVSFALGHFHLVEKDIEAAADYLSTAIKQDSPPARAFVELADIQCGTSPQKALETLRAGKKRLPENPLITFSLACALSDIGHYTKAIKLFEEARFSISGTPGSSALSQAYYLSFGEACERAGKIRKAEAIFLQCLEAHPKSHVAMNYLAYMWAQNNVNLNAALGYVNKALELSPGNGAYIDTLGWIYYRQGKFDEALTELHRAHDILGNDPEIIDHIGEIMEAMEATSQ